MLKGFTKHDVKKIEDESDLDNEILSFKLNNTKRQVAHKNSNNSFMEFMCKSEMEKELIRVSLKERALKIVLEGSRDYKKDLDEIFYCNKERHLFNPNDQNFLFNQPFSDNKKNLLYIACQEGNFEIVNYFISKNLNPNLKSKTDDNEYETCLQVAVRWNYVDIVKLLLEKCKLSEVEVSEAMKNCFNKQILNLLKQYLKEKYGAKGKKSGCACF